jgi:hypothetical protein
MPIGAAPNGADVDLPPHHGAPICLPYSLKKSRIEMLLVHRGVNFSAFATVHSLRSATAQQRMGANKNLQRSTYPK